MNHRRDVGEPSRSDRTLTRSTPLGVTLVHVPLAGTRLRRFARGREAGQGAQGKYRDVGILCIVNK